MMEKCNACDGTVGADVVRADFLAFCNEACANSWLEARLEEEEIEDQRYVPDEEAKFLASLRQEGANKPLQEMAEGLFQLKSHPLDYAYGLTIGAGLIRCECGLWGDVDDLTENNIPIPCPHQTVKSIADIQRLLSSGFDDWKSLGNVYIKENGCLTLFNYTPRATYGDNWNYFELVSRGLIINSATGEIVGRPFDKFFNYGQDRRFPTSAIKSVTEKMDGSLGILYRDNGGYRVATRGSFESDQAQWATDYLSKYFDLAGLPNEMTLLFEIIYPDNRIVIDYGGMEALILIAARNRFTGEHYSQSEVNEIGGKFKFPLPRAKTFDSIKQIADACFILDGNNEGWVVEFEDGQRFKFKGDPYMELHRLISGLSFKNTLRYIKDGEVEKLLSNTPDEFLSDVKRWIAEIDYEVAKVSGKAKAAFEAAPKGSRKEFAQWVIKNHKNLSTYLFAMLDGKPVEPLIYKIEF